MSHRRMKYENMRTGKKPAKKLINTTILRFANRGFIFFGYLWFFNYFFFSTLVFFFFYNFKEKLWEQISFLNFFDLRLKIFSIYYQVGSLLWLIGRQISAWEMFIFILEKVLIMETFIIFFKSFLQLTEIITRDFSLCLCGLLHYINSSAWLNWYIISTEF